METHLKPFDPRRVLPTACTAALWTLSGLVLAACGGGSSGGSPGRGSFPTGLASYEDDDVIFNVSGGMVMDIMLPRHVSRNIQPYEFKTPVSIPATIKNEPTEFRADGSLPALAFGVPVKDNVPMLDAGDWVRVISMGMSNLPNEWNGDYKAEGPQGSEFRNNPFSSDKMRVNELYIKLVDTHTLDDTVKNWQNSLTENLVHKIYFDADVFRNGNAYEGNIKGTLLVQDGDDGARGDVDLYLTADIDGSGDTTGDPTHRYTLSGNSFNVDTFRNIDNDVLSGRNKNLLGYMVGGDLGNNYLIWIDQSVDGGAGPNGALAVANSDTIYADFYINIPAGWNVRLIWWLDDVLEDIPDDFVPTTPSNGELPRDQLGLDRVLDFNYAGLFADPDMIFTDIASTTAFTATNGIPTPEQINAGVAHASENPMIRGVNRTMESDGSYTYDVAEDDEYISGFSDITDPSNQFAPKIAGRYYVQVVAYDPEAMGTPEQKSDGTMESQDEANTRAQIETAYFGFDNLHEIDVQTADFDQALFDAFYNSPPPEVA